jgi:biotin carboxyl carrier protein
MAELISTIAGKIKEVNIKVGQMVTEDDEAFIIEAMKMENVIYGEAGVVKEVSVQAGDSVEEGVVLAIVV